MYERQTSFDHFGESGEWVDQNSPAHGTGAISFFTLMQGAPQISGPNIANMYFSGITSIGIVGVRSPGLSDLYKYV